MKKIEKFNKLSFNEFKVAIDNHKRITINHLGLYRGILESKLTDVQKIEIRDYANTVFGKFYEFLQIKDAHLYFALHYLGEELSNGEEHIAWKQITNNQAKLLKEKGLNHRNFGDYSKHICGHSDCPFEGLMIKKSRTNFYSESPMVLKCDRQSKSSAQLYKREKLKKEHKEEIEEYNLRVGL